MYDSTPCQHKDSVWEGYRAGNKNRCNVVISGYRRKAGESLWYMILSPANQRLIPVKYQTPWRFSRTLQVLAPALPRCWSKVFTLASGLTWFYFGVVCSDSDHQLMRLSAPRAAVWHWSVDTWCLGLCCTSSSRSLTQIQHEHTAAAAACADPRWTKSTTGMFSSWLSALNPITESVTYDFNVIR